MIRIRLIMPGGFSVFEKKIIVSQDKLYMRIVVIRSKR